MTTKRTLRSLHIGVGGRGQWPIKLATAPDSGFQPVTLCDLSQAALEGARQVCGLDASRCHTGLDEALKSAAEADCAIICAPTHLHVPLVKRCVEAGLPTLVEKGMAPSWAEACDLVNFVEKRGAK